MHAPQNNEQHILAISAERILRMLQMEGCPPCHSIHPLQLLQATRTSPTASLLQACKKTLWVLYVTVECIWEHCWPSNQPTQAKNTDVKVDDLLASHTFMSPQMRVRASALSRPA